MIRTTHLERGAETVYWPQVWKIQAGKGSKQLGHVLMRCWVPGPGTKRSLLHFNLVILPNSPSWSGQCYPILKTRKPKLKEVNVWGGCQSQDSNLDLSDHKAHVLKYSISSSFWLGICLSSNICICFFFKFKTNWKERGVRAEGRKEKGWDLRFNNKN